MTQVRSRSLFGALLLCASWLPAQAQTLYRLTPIVVDQPTPTALFASDLNEQGQVVGSDWFGGSPHAFAWRDGTATKLGPLIDPGSTRTNAQGTNNRGDIVGDFTDSQTGVVNGFLLRRGAVMKRIEGLPGATATYPFDINNHRQIVGTVEDGPVDQRGFLWEAGTGTQLRPLRGDSYAGPFSINERGVAAGVSVGETSHAVIWRNGRVHDLGLPNSNASDINDHGQVIGTSSDENGEHAFLWWRRQVTYLPALEGDVSFATPRTINNLGDIVGRTFYPGRTVATLWSGGTVIDLNERISADDPLQPLVTLDDAELIDDQGRIVASGRDSRTPNRLSMYFLTPVP